MSAIFSFAHKTIIITGAGSGIGQGLSKFFVDAGALVIGVSRNQLNLDETAGLCKDALGSFIGIAGDLSIVEDVVRVADLCVEAAGSRPIDGLVNNAGVAKCTPFLETRADDFDWQIAVNVRAVMLMSQTIVKAMIAAKATAKNYFPAIVNVSSQASSVGIASHTAYCASKGALDQLTRTMATELGVHGIRVNSINPTVVLTDLGRANWSDPAVATPMLDMIPLGRFAEVSEMCGPVAFLLSSAASMVHGTMLSVDGGVLCNRSSQAALRSQMAKHPVV